MRAVVVHRLGDPSVLELSEVPVPEVGAGQVRVAVRAVAVNFRDVQQRRRRVPGTSVPFVPGSDFAGEVVAVAEGVRGLRVGDRVAGVAPGGAYAEQVVAPAEALFPIPDGVDFACAAIVPVAGLSASFLVSVAGVTAGATAVTYAAAGGLGCFLGGVLAGGGVRSIGLVSSGAKAEVARAAGHHDTVVYPEVDPVVAVRELTGGRGADVVFDSVGGPDFARSFQMAADGATVVLCGRAAGDPDLGKLGDDFIEARRNLALREFSLGNLLAGRLGELRGRLAGLLGGLVEGRIRVPITEWGLDDVARAHERLESAATVGKLVLRP